MQFQNGCTCNKIAIELQVVQFWSEVKLVIYKKNKVWLFDFEIIPLISDQIAHHSSITIINLSLLLKIENLEG